MAQSKRTKLLETLLSRRRRRRLFTLTALVAGLSSISTAGSAAQSDVALAMPDAQGAPKILGPRSVANKPASPFLYAVAAVGQRPLTFAATGLPVGLTLSADSGVISGTTPAAGSYPVVVTVTNAMGSAQRDITLISGDVLAQTPPMGWNSYDSFGGSVTEAEVMQAAEAQKEQLQPHGWNYVVVDYLWYDDPPTNVPEIDANGRFLPSKSRFPSATGNLGFQPLADKVHALGLSFGIHIMRGIPRRAYTANSPIANSTSRAQDAANPSDPCAWDNHMWGVHGDTPAGQAWYDSIFAQYASWGIDFVKVDDMIYNTMQPYRYRQAEVTAIHAAVQKTGRSIVLSLSPGPMSTTDAAHLNANANMWRMVDDFWDAKGLSTLADVFTAAGKWQATSGLTQGHWPDADMLPLGYIGPRAGGGHTSGATHLTRNEQVSVMTLWGILPSPLILGGNVARLTTDATGPLTLSLLTNDEVIAVNQDAEGKRGKLIAQSGSQQTWVKELAGGRKAVAFFNRGEADVAMSVTAAQLGLTGTYAARDLWKRTDVAPVTDGLAATVPWRGAALYLLSPPSAADAGAEADLPTGSGARDSSVDASDTGIVVSGGGAGTEVGDGSGGVGGRGEPGSDGNAGVAGGSAGSAPTSGGSGGLGGAGQGAEAQPSSSASNASSGCACALGAGSRASHWELLGAVGLAAAIRRRLRSL